jgi:hypothetical protein
MQAFASWIDEAFGDVITIDKGTYGRRPALARDARQEDTTSIDDSPKARYG